MSGLLDPHATVIADGGGLVSAALRPIEGGEQIARYVVDIAGPAPALDHYQVPKWCAWYRYVTLARYALAWLAVTAASQPPPPPCPPRRPRQGEGGQPVAGAQPGT